MSELVFVKLGGSVITDKTRIETARPDVIARIACEVASARAEQPGLKLVLGHGSGSFGHVVARRFGTREGVHGADAWRGFAEVAAVAARLNRIVVDAFREAGVPVWSLQPSASDHYLYGTDLCSPGTTSPSRSADSGWHCGWRVRCRSRARSGRAADIQHLDSELGIHQSSPGWVAWHRCDRRDAVQG
jgi:hypothetical protein